ncbi:hypothetical protein BCA37_21110 [Mycobacterium sp. djl-10]|nr:hypothetical protein BCA37_21110 [Mycobacterium sp. djl-10]
MKKTLVTIALTGALGAVALGAGAGSAAAHPDPWVPLPPPGQVAKWVGVPPGQIGQVVGVPPGHWDKPWKWLK